MKSKNKKRPKAKFLMLTDAGVELIERNHRMKTTHYLYDCGANLEDKASCRIALSIAHFHPSVIERHLEDSMELAQILKERMKA